MSLCTVLGTASGVRGSRSAGRSLHAVLLAVCPPVSQCHHFVLLVPCRDALRVHSDRCAHGSPTSDAPPAAARTPHGPAGLLGFRVFITLTLVVTGRPVRFSAVKTVRLSWLRLSTS